MPSKHEESMRCLINFNASRGWRDAAHKRAAALGRTLTEHIKMLVDIEQEEAAWRSIANDLYMSAIELEDPSVLTKSAMIRYERQRDGRA